MMFIRCSRAPHARAILIASSRPAVAAALPSTGTRMSRYMACVRGSPGSMRNCFCTGPRRGRGRAHKSRASGSLSLPARFRSPSAAAADDTDVRLVPAPGRHRPSPAAELPIDLLGDARQLLPVGAARQRIAEVLVDPVEDVHGAVVPEAERRLRPTALLGRLAGDVERQPLTLVVVVHEQRHWSSLAGQEATANEVVAYRLEQRRADRRAEALRQPRHELLLLFGADLDRPAHLGAV